MTTSKSFSIEINNMLGIKSANMTLHPGMNLITGQNNAGKTSVLRVIAALTCGIDVPVLDDKSKPVIPKKQALELVYRGEKSGSAKIAHGEDSLTLKWPGCNWSGVPFLNLTPLALGLTDWQGEADKVTLFDSLLSMAGRRAIPTKDEFFAAVGETPLSRPWWKQVETVGWDKAADGASKEWSSLTGEWRAATGETYGAEKAKTWKPVGWVQNLEALTDVDLDKAIQEAIAAHSKGEANAAVDKFKLESVREVAGQAEMDVVDVKSLEKRQEDYNDDWKMELANLKLKEQPSRKNQEDRTNFVLEIDELKLKIARYSHSSTAKVHDGSCELCGGTGVLMTGVKPIRYVVSRVKEKVEPPESEKKQHMERLDSIEKLLADHDAKQASAAASYADEMAKINASRKQTAEDLRKEYLEKLSANTVANEHNKHIRYAKAKLAQLESQGPGLTPMEITILRDKIKSATDRKKIWEQNSKATKAALGASEMYKIRAALARDGLRASKMGEGLAWVNQELAKICTAATWEAVEIGFDFNLSIGGRPYGLLSMSEKWRANAVMQSLFAMTRGSAVIAFDGADIMIGAVRGGLIKMAKALLSDRVVIIAMSATKEYVQGVRTVFKSVYWAESGVVAHFNS